MPVGISKALVWLKWITFDLCIVKSENCSSSLTCHRKYRHKTLPRAETFFFKLRLPHSIHSWINLYSVFSCNYSSITGWTVGCVDTWIGSVKGASNLNAAVMMRQWIPPYCALKGLSCRWNDFSRQRLHFFMTQCYNNCSCGVITVFFKRMTKCFLLCVVIRGITSTTVPACAIATVLYCRSVLLDVHFIETLLIRHK